MHTARGRLGVEAHPYGAAGRQDLVAGIDVRAREVATAADHLSRFDGAGDNVVHRTQGDRPVEDVAEQIDDRPVRAVADQDHAQDQLPYVGDVPVLGALFRSTDYQKSETDLVILVTPHIVRPMTPTEPAHSPLDNTLPPNDADLLLEGKTEVSPNLARFAAGGLSRPYVGHILDLPQYGGAYVSAKN